MSHENKRFQKKNATTLLKISAPYTHNSEWVQVSLPALQKQMAWNPVEDDYKEKHYAAFEGYIYPEVPTALFNKKELEKDAGISTGVTKLTEIRGAEILQDKSKKQI